MIYRLLKPLLFRMDPEEAHNLVTRMLSKFEYSHRAQAILTRLFTYRDPILGSTWNGLQLANPLGLAAGFDKHAQLVATFHAMGFGHVEVGTVTPRPQAGNPKPRMFRLPEDAALINRLGFNSPGTTVVREQLRMIRKNAPQAVVGVNIGKNRDTPLENASADYLAAYQVLAPFADYITVNISSPNTPGLRQLHERQALETLLTTLTHANRQAAHPRPLMLKVSPDESDEQIEMVVGVGLAAGFSGFIATNTTLDRAKLRSAAAEESGGLSGAPLAKRSLAVTQQIARLCRGKASVVSVGGIHTGQDAYQRIRGGASLVQCYTALVYHGPTIARQINREIAVCLRRDGFSHLQQAIGVDCC
jgi:dihydroorotate dehydrogenase